jgi:mannose-6-phosphate isomerase-like protein (cupin superfamily)
MITCPLELLQVVSRLDRAIERATKTDQDRKQHDRHAGTYRSTTSGGPQRAAAAVESASLHPYMEVFLVRRGNAEFTIGSQTITVQAGQWLTIPPATAHRFRTLGPERYESLAIHLSPRFISSVLQAPDTQE